MRRRRLIRSAYRTGAKKKSVKKIIIRVLFVLACVIMTTAVALLVGSYLDEKAQIAESLLETEEPGESATDMTELFPDGVLSDSDAASEKVCAAHIDVVGAEPSEIKEAINALGDVYNAVSVNLVSESGSLVYLSEALMNHVRLDGELALRRVVDESTEEKTDALHGIMTVIRTADELGMRKSGVLSVSPNVLLDTSSAFAEKEVDGILLGELASFGFDEVVLTSLVSEEDEITTELLKRIVSYLAILREYSDGIDIGVMLPSSVYLVPQSAGFIKTLSEYVDFLAISVSTDAEDPASAYSAVYDNCHSLKGNFSVYNIRGVINVSDGEIAAAVFSALGDLSAASMQFSVYIPTPDYKPEIPDVSIDESTTEGIGNQNAVSKEDYMTDDETGTNEE